MNRCIQSAAAIACLATASSASAQLQGRTCLTYATNTSSSPVYFAAVSLEMSMTATFIQPEQWLIDKLQAQSWDLVDINFNEQFVQKQLIADLLEAHVKSGGKIIVNYPQLDEWPEVWPLLGVTPVKDRDKPERFEAPDPGNPILPNAQGSNHETDLWPDNGDNLQLAQGSGVIAVFDEPGLPVAAAINPTRSVCTHGFDWDSMGFGGSLATAKLEVSYLFSCKADFTGDNTLDVFDFLDFLNKFNAKDRHANMNFDNAFDLFDFLDFINRFNEGCQ